MNYKIIFVAAVIAAVTQTIASYFYGSMMAVLTGASAGILVILYALDDNRPKFKLFNWRVKRHEV